MKFKLFFRLPEWTSWQEANYTKNKPATKEELDVLIYTFGFNSTDIEYKTEPAVDKNETER